MKLEQESGIGGHIDPKKTETDPEAEAKQRLATERRLAKDLAVLQAENRKEEIDRMQAGTEKKLAITQEYEKRIAEAATEGEQKTLQEELKKKMADLDM